MIRYWFLLHRYLGIVCAFIMLLWTLSGIVMMYKSYPRLSEQDALQWMQIIKLSDCCELGGISGLDGNVSDLSLFFRNSKSVLSFSADEKFRAFNLADGLTAEPITADSAHKILQQIAESRISSTINIVEFEKLVRDQWTVYSAYNKHRPLYKAALDDEKNTHLYLSSSTGRIVQVTTWNSRIWGYLGAVVHWIYPAQLRQHTAVWYQLVVWLSILGVFLTVTGIFVGVKQFKRRRGGRLSPYRGFALYHHYLGLFFGVLTLLWVFSGLLSMNPAGLLESEGISEEEVNLQGVVIPGNQVESLVNKLDRFALSDQVVELRWRTWGDRLVLLEYDLMGLVGVYDANTFESLAIEKSDLKTRVEAMLPDRIFESTKLIDAEDDYYYGHHKEVELPVFRVITESGIRYYLSAKTGLLVEKVDSAGQWYRWLFKGFHRGDFTTTLRQRPLWDSFMIFLLSGVALLCFSGCYMGIKRISMMRKKRRKLKLKAQAS